MRWVLAVTLILSADSATAYVCTQADAESGDAVGASLSWPQREIEYTLHATGTADVPGAQEVDALRASFAPWGYTIDAAGNVTGTPPQEDVGAMRSTDLAFRERETLSLRDGVGYDFLNPELNENLLIFRDDDWPIPGQNTSVIALTTTSYNALTGEIFDADIEFNAFSFNFTVVDNPGPGDTDLMNTAVHEIGHMLGLAHSGLASATMYAQADSAETSKRVLDRDDANGIVFKYPAGETNGYCHPDTAGCTCTPPGELSALVEVVVTNPGDSRFGDVAPEVGCGATNGLPLWPALLALLALRRRLS